LFGNPGRTKKDIENDMIKEILQTTIRKLDVAGMEGPE
jgi:hypothetical protein